MSAFNPKQELYPLVNGADAARNSESKDFARYFTFVLVAESKISQKA